MAASPALVRRNERREMRMMGDATTAGGGGAAYSRLPAAVLQMWRLHRKEPPIRGGQPRTLLGVDGKQDEGDRIDDPSHTEVGQYGH